MCQWVAICGRLLARQSATARTLRFAMSSRKRGRGRSEIRSASAIGDFTSVASIRCTDGEHINLREARAAAHYLKWILLSTARHRRRLVPLVGSRVVVGAVGKGRSSSQPLNVFPKSIAALCFAVLEAQVIYIPAEINPADYPSRGLRVPGRPSRRCLASVLACVFWG